MQTYPVSREARKGLNPADLSAKISEVFGVSPKNDGETLVVSYLAIKELKIRTDGKSLLVETLMEPKVPEVQQMATIKAYNHFLELATGLTAKERAKKLQAAAKKAAAQ